MVSKTKAREWNLPLAVGRHTSCCPHAACFCPQFHQVVLSAISGPSRVAWEWSTEPHPSVGSCQPPEMLARLSVGPMEASV